MLGTLLLGIYTPLYLGTMCIYSRGCAAHNISVSHLPSWSLKSLLRQSIPLTLSRQRLVSPAFSLEVKSRITTHVGPCVTIRCREDKLAQNSQRKIWYSSSPQYPTIQ
ncbi:hypothetical protein HYPSUDRAFT_913991 [Hypholoma sublateritium FD-334 SS-4]|uniref:Uncharacterized protein n=1 Tax=Hypholoma sublateritium (strain FD-334 SS-4) TaxID=945553 RepID=A0A0D2PF64_HYPSF|nr:hypothetical protein HYPSUDRAFT_913991 [Hypholoma sublateritium FD-334 SS-4]